MFTTCGSLGVLAHELTEEQLRTYLLQLTTTRASATVTQALSALRFFYEQTLGRHWAILDLARPPRDKKLPAVLSRDEVARIMKHVDGVAWIIVALLYGAGLRLQECLELRVKDSILNDCRS